MHQCIMKTIEACDPREAGESAAEQTIAASDSSKSISRFSLMSERESTLMLCFKTQSINFWRFANLYVTSTKASPRHLGQLKSALSHIIILYRLQLFPVLLWTGQQILKAPDIPIIWLSPLTAMGAGECRSQALCSWIHLNVTPPASLGHSMRRMNMDDGI